MLYIIIGLSAKGRYACTKIKNDDAIAMAPAAWCNSIMAFYPFRKMGVLPQ